MESKSETSDVDMTAPMPKYAYVRCFDMVDDLVEVELAILEPFRPRIYNVIKYEPPDVDADGRKFWRCGLPIHVFTSLLVSLRTRRLCVGKNCSLDTLMHAFEFEGIILATPFDAPAHFERPAGPQRGIAFPTLAEPAVVSLKAIAEQAATAIVSWPRLEEMLRTAKTSPGLPRACVSTTRAWLAFDLKPTIDRPDTNADKIVHLCSRWPKWLRTLLLGIGITRAQMIRAEKLGEDHSQEAYKILTTSISASPSGVLWFLNDDTPSFARTANENADYHSAHTWGQFVRTSILGAARLLENDHDKVAFSRSIVQFASNVLTNSPAFSTIFGAECADANGGTIERKFLHEALRERGVDIVRWTGTGGPSGGGAPLPEVARPLCFPGLSEAETKTVCLLDFSRVL